MRTIVWMRIHQTWLYAIRYVMAIQLALFLTESPMKYKHGGATTHRMMTTIRPTPPC